MYQVVAVYPSGNRYPVREPHVTRANAEWHRDLCIRTMDPEDPWTYDVDRVRPFECLCPDDCNCRHPWRTNYCGCRAHEDPVL